LTQSYLLTMVREGMKGLHNPGF